MAIALGEVERFCGVSGAIIYREYRRVYRKVGHKTEGVPRDPLDRLDSGLIGREFGSARDIETSVDKMSGGSSGKGSPTKAAPHLPLQQESRFQFRVISGSFAPGTRDATP